MILRALKKYGMILADNGSPWYISGAPSPGWNDDLLVSELRRLKGSDFEAVDVSSLFLTGDSGQAAVDAPPPPPASLVVSAPNGGEEWRIGKSSRVAWAASGLTGKIKVELSRDGGTTWSSLAKATLNDGRQEFKVTGPGTMRARVRLTSVAQPQITDTSDAEFRIR